MEKINTELNELVNITYGINTLHSEISKQWTTLKGEQLYNLKKVQVRNVLVNNNSNEIPEYEFDLKFISYMNDYCNLLNSIYIHPAYDTLDCNLPFKSRIKEPASRISKIYSYQTEKEEGGKVNLKKCLNDLLGFRVWVNDFDHSVELSHVIADRIDLPHIKVYNASKGDYRATHIYFFNGNNTYFPWELQIWNKSDHVSNDNSHSIHKQGYTEWPSIYYKGSREGTSNV